MDNDSETWRGVGGRNGLLYLNPSGVLLLDFCAHHVFPPLISVFIYSVNKKGLLKLSFGHSVSFNKLL